MTHVLDDNTRQLGGAIDLVSFRDGPSEAEKRRARLESLMLFRERFRFDFGLNMETAHFFQCDGDDMRPHFGQGDWLVLDTTKDRIRSEEFYVVEFPQTNPYVRFAPVPRLVQTRREGMRFFATNDPEGREERIVPYPELASVVVLGAIRAVFKNPNKGGQHGR